MHDGKVGLLCKRDAIELGCWVNRMQWSCTVGYTGYSRIGLLGKSDAVELYCWLNGMQ